MTRFLLAALLLIGCSPSPDHAAPRPFTNVTSEWRCTLDQRPWWCLAELEQVRQDRYTITLHAMQPGTEWGRFEAAGPSGSVKTRARTTTRQRAQRPFFPAPVNQLHPEESGVEVDWLLVDSRPDVDLRVFLGDVRIAGAQNETSRADP